MDKAHQKAEQTFSFCDNNESAYIVNRKRLAHVKVCIK